MVCVLAWKDMQPLEEMFVANGLEKGKTHSCWVAVPATYDNEQGQGRAARSGRGLGKQPFLSFSFIPEAAGGREGGLWPSLGLERSLLAAFVGRPGG